jgi:ketosteroid isomerase-like protein
MKTMPNIAFAPFCCAAMISLFSNAQADPSERQAIIDSMQGWERAVESADYQRLGNYYMEHAVYYPNGAPPVVGRDAIVERNRQRGSSAAVRITQKVDDIQIQKDWAIYSCLASIAISTDSGESLRYVRVLLVMQKDTDGRWKILRDMDNTTPETFEEGG